MPVAVVTGRRAQAGSAFRLMQSRGAVEIRILVTPRAYVSVVNLQMSLTDSTQNSLLPERLGAVYTPRPIAHWLALEVTRRVKDPAPRVLDPAVGDGALLAAMKEVMPEARLAGIDIDPMALQEARKVLPSATLACADALLADWSISPSGPDALIANPPWGAETRLSGGRLRSAGLSLAKGQFDSFELFLERAIMESSVGTVGAFLVPDSILQPEHESVRRLLLTRTSVELLVRLGEGIFEGVFRGTVAIVFRVGRPLSDAEVRCYRLDQAKRRAVLSGMVSMAKLIAADGHLVPQARFSMSSNALLDLDVRQCDLRVTRKLASRSEGWHAWLESARGVEIGKSGSVLECPDCGSAKPVPRQRLSHPATCDCCHSTLEETSIVAESSAVVGDSHQHCWEPFVVGEDVARYRVTVRRVIRMGVRGIRYKDANTYRPRKLIVRKTGIGLAAAIDDSGAYTSQTVFIFTPTGIAPPFALDYALGVLSSRVTAAFHLLMSGENEWRSHPYVTPTTLQRLPLPVPRPGTWQWAQAESIADAARALLYADDLSAELDLRVDGLVAGLFELTDSDCKWVVRVLDEAQPLKQIVQLRIPSGRSLQPLTV
jgi:hypothetical protein